MKRSIPFIYAIYSCTVFWAGVNGKIDAFIWGFLSFMGYWPLSMITHGDFIWDDLSIYEGGAHSRILGFYTPHVLSFVFDVVIGTAWWSAVAWSFPKIRYLAVRRRK